MTDQVNTPEVEEVVETIETPVEDVKAEEIVEIVEAEAPAEEKSDDLDIVKKAVDQVASENAELKAAALEAQTKADELVKELEAKAERLEELEAKASAPMINLNKKDSKMEAKELFATFVKDGVEGLQTKAGDLQISVDAQGGYSVPEELRQEIIRLEHEMSPIRQVASVVTASTSDVKQLVSVGNAASGWVGETDARAQTDSPELAQRTAVFGEVYARPRVYAHMLEDSFFNAEGWLTQEVARQFAEAEGTAFLNGDGSNKPKGLIDGLTLSASAPANDVTGAYAVATSAADGALGADAGATVDFLRNVVQGVKTGYLSGAKFMMNRATHGVLASLKNADGEYFLNREITEAAASKLFGFDIIINDDMDGIPTTTGTAAPIIFGNFARAYQIVDRTGVSVLRDPYSNPGSVMFYSRKRVGSMILDASALTVIGVAKS